MADIQKSTNGYVTNQVQINNTNYLTSQVPTNNTDYLTNHVLLHNTDHLTRYTTKTLILISNWTCTNYNYYLTNHRLKTVIEKD